MSRGVAFAAVAVTLAVSAHVLGGGSVPDPVSLTFLAVPVAWVSFFLTRARRRWPTIVGSLVAVEAGLHEGLSALSGQGFSATSMNTPMSGHGAMVGPVALMPATDAASGMTGAPSLGMIAAHLVATVLTGAVLAHGEHLLWSLWAWLRRAISVPASTVGPVLVGRGIPSWLPTANPVPAVVDRSVRRRGPPNGALCAPVFG